MYTDIDITYCQGKIDINFIYIVACNDEFISLTGDSLAYSVFAEYTRFCGLATNSIQAVFALPQSRLQNTDLLIQESICSFRLIKNIQLCVNTVNVSKSFHPHTYDQPQVRLLLPHSRSSLTIKDVIFRRLDSVNLTIHTFISNKSCNFDHYFL